MMTMTYKQTNITSLVSSAVINTIPLGSYALITQMLLKLNRHLQHTLDMCKLQLPPIVII